MIINLPNDCTHVYTTDCYIPTNMISQIHIDNNYIERMNSYDLQPNNILSINICEKMSMGDGMTN